MKYVMEPCAAMVKQYELNLKKAEELLVQLGYDSLDDKGIRKNKDGSRLSFNLLVSGEVRLAEVLKEQLAKVGIGLTVQSIDSKSRDARVLKNEYELVVTGHGGWGGDPDYLSERFTGVSKGATSPSVAALRGYNNEQLNTLLEEQSLATNDQKRKELVFDIQNNLAEDVPEIPIYYTTGYSVYKPAKYDGSGGSYILGWL